MSTYIHTYIESLFIYVWLNVEEGDLLLHGISITILGHGYNHSLLLIPSSFVSINFYFTFNFIIGYIYKNKTKQPIFYFLNSTNARPRVGKNHLPPLLVTQL